MFALVEPQFAAESAKEIAAASGGCPLLRSSQDNEYLPNNNGRAFARPLFVASAICVEVSASSLTNTHIAA